MSPSKSLKGDANAVGTPRELAPRSALQMNRQHGTGDDAGLVCLMDPLLEVDVLGA